MMVSQAEELQLGARAYREVLDKEKILTHPAMTRQVERVGRAIAAVADKPDYDWEFAVIDAPATANAFALPGGKVAVYSGLFAVAQNDAGLATVIGHEVAHALARHGAERMSEGAVAQLVGQALSVAVSGKSAATRDAVMQAYGLGAQVGVMLPYSRQMESEADHIGLILMAKAGYDPSASIGLWERMGKFGKAGRPPELLSTHPHPETRIEQLRQWMPEAEGYYRRAASRPPIEPLPAVSPLAGQP